jgi:hypothetical protein
MGTMNFSIPDDVKNRFNQTFANKNKSAIVTQLLEEAVAHAERKQQSSNAIQRILMRRDTAPDVTMQEILNIRDQIRTSVDVATDLAPDTDAGIPTK